ncbi:hypothetical protein HELRODRAFT_166966 [Helobdella robusta]|uniref:Uncharacterized protein n=1 Tax=Helobdella robusta TaxID=6412 RepID=T1EYT7_HELRO|nr:hypothetical protein HELRODRAFT_166966 [Helobdella robusta]ESO11881.1 hypothetical protein HELRODRAFT_166966 [Helobdella robusta]
MESDAAKDRERRKNNIIAFNIPENELKIAVKQAIFKMFKKMTNVDIKDEIEGIFRIGKKQKMQHKKIDEFNNGIIGHDLSDEDRNTCRKLLEEKRREISLKNDPAGFSFKIRGTPADLEAIRLTAAECIPVFKSSLTCPQPSIKDPSNKFCITVLKHQKMVFTNPENWPVSLPMWKFTHSGFLLAPL